MLFTNYNRSSVWSLNAGVKKLWEVVRATCSYPGLFDPIDLTIHGVAHRFIDGSQGPVNVINELLEESRAAFQSRGPVVEVLLSLGAGQPSAHSFGGPLKELTQSMIRASEAAERTFNAFRRMNYQIQHDKLYRFSPPDLDDGGPGESDQRFIIEARIAAYADSPEIKRQLSSLAMGGLSWWRFNTNGTAIRRWAPHTEPEYVGYQYTNTVAGSVVGEMAPERRANIARWTNYKSSNDSVVSWIDTQHRPDSLLDGPQYDGPVIGPEDFLPAEVDIPNSGPSTSVQSPLQSPKVNDPPAYSPLNLNDLSDVNIETLVQRVAIANAGLHEKMAVSDQTDDRDHGHLDKSIQKRSASRRRKMDTGWPKEVQVTWKCVSKSHL